MTETALPETVTGTVTSIRAFVPESTPSSPLVSAAFATVAPVVDGLAHAGAVRRVPRSPPRVRWCGGRCPTLRPASRLWGCRKGSTWHDRRDDGGSPGVSAGPVPVNNSAAFANLQPVLKPQIHPQHVETENPGSSHKSRADIRRRASSVHRPPPHRARRFAQACPQSYPQVELRARWAAPSVNRQARAAACHPMSQARGCISERTNRPAEEWCARVDR